MAGNTYSFADVQGAIVGPGGSCNIGYGAGPSDEGITVSMVDEKVSTVYGADGTVMHSLHASKGGRVTVRLLKTSPANAILDVMYRFDTTSSANCGQNIINVRNPVRGDTITGTQMAFAKLPDVVYGKDGPMNEWTWNGPVDMILGDGTPG